MRLPSLPSFAPSPLPPIYQARGEREYLNGLLAERQLGKSSSPEKGRNLIKQVRTQLLELARPMLESLVHEVTGIKVVSMHHDISTVTGEEVVVFALAESPHFG